MSPTQNQHTAKYFCVFLYKLTAFGMYSKSRRNFNIRMKWNRIAVEGKFGQGKRRFSLARIMTKLAGTSEVAIMISFIVMNLEKILTEIGSFLLFVWHWLSVQLWQRRSSLDNMVLTGYKTAA